MARTVTLSSEMLFGYRHEETGYCKSNGANTGRGLSSQFAFPSYSKIICQMAGVIKHVQDGTSFVEDADNGNPGIGEP